MEAVEKAEFFNVTFATFPLFEKFIYIFFLNFKKIWSHRHSFVGFVDDFNIFLISPWKWQTCRRNAAITISRDLFLSNVQCDFKMIARRVLVFHFLFDSNFRFNFQRYPSPVQSSRTTPKSFENTRTGMPKWKKIYCDIYQNSWSLQFQK